MRQTFKKHDILVFQQGSLCDDIVVSLCCMCCSWCQMAREIKKHKSATVVIVQSQPTPATNIQIQAGYQGAPQPQPPAYPQVVTGLVPQLQPQNV